MENNILEKIISNKKAEEAGKLNAIKVVNHLFDDLLERERDVLSRRFGLHGDKSETLEKIGGLHKLTRERVRQIEATSIKKLKKLDNLDQYLETIKNVVGQLLTSHGGLMPQDYLLDILATFCADGKNSEGERESYKKHFDFLISRLLEDDFEKVEKSDHFETFYKNKEQAIGHLEEVAKELRANIEKAKQTMNIGTLIDLIKNLDAFNKNVGKLGEGNPVDLTSIFKHEVFPEAGEVINSNKVLYSLINAIKNLDRNKFGDWGLNSWPEVKPKKISDKIYLVLKKSGEPMHFTEIANKINEVGFDAKKANPGTCHNELILDDRYVLVDRGMYGLKEWQNK
jgi:hypothetical protein